MKARPSSLRGRLVVGAVALGLVFSIGFGAIALWRIQHAEDQAISAALSSRIDLARDEVGADGTLSTDAGSPKTDLVQVLGPDGAVRSSSAALRGVPALLDLAPGSTPAVGSAVTARVALQQPDIDLAVLAVPLDLPQAADSPAGRGALVVAVDAEGFNTASRDLLGLLVLGLVLVVVAMGVLAWVLTGRALRTVTRLSEQAETLRAGASEAELPVPEGDAELARLVGALNRMLSRLHEHHATEMAFAADAGHRLRTPVATLRAEAELALRSHDPTVMSQALVEVVRDADQLTSIVDRMLARSRPGEQSAHRVVQTFESAVPRWHRQAELAGVVLTADLDPLLSPTTTCSGLLDVVEPILDNAVRHTPSAGCVQLRAVANQAAMLVVEITNQGAPIDADLVPHVFDAWVSTRDASVAGGLGLWLARETARDRGGDVDLLGSAAGTTTFRVRLPVSVGP